MCFEVLHDVILWSLQTSVEHNVTDGPYEDLDGPVVRLNPTKHRLPWPDPILLDSAPARGTPQLVTTMPDLPARLLGGRARTAEGR